jgi:uncharacterized protein (DUF1015 family)
LVDIKPFKALRYSKKAGEPENLITQPYDKIDPQMQNEYYAKSPYNYCRLILPIEANRYEIVQQRIMKWLEEKILTKDAKPSFFVIRQDFTVEGKNCCRTGMIAAVRLYAYGENVVFPHETTYSAPKLDRLNMLRTVQKDLEPVFLIYSDQQKETLRFFDQTVKSTPILEVKDSFDVTHRVWQVSDPEKIGWLQKTLEPKTLVITDGHHRYESALAYRDEMRQKGFADVDLAFNFHLSMLVPVEDDGLMVLPTHRLLTKIKLTQPMLEHIGKFFTVQEISHSASDVDKFLETHRNEHAFAVYTKQKAYGLLLKHKEMVYEFVSSKASKETKLFDVVILRDVVFKAIMKTGELKMDDDILYVRWTKAAVEKVDSGEAQVAFLVNPIVPQTVWNLAQMHERLPEKSTDFYPKMASGLMMMDIDSKEKL